MKIGIIGYKLLILTNRSSEKNCRSGNFAKFGNGSIVYCHFDLVTRIFLMWKYFAKNKNLKFA